MNNGIEVSHGCGVVACLDCRLGRIQIGFRQTQKGYIGIGNILSRLRLILIDIRVLLAVEAQELQTYIAGFSLSKR